MTCANWHTGEARARLQERPKPWPRSPVYEPPNIGTRVRAKRAYMNTKRTNKYGKEVPCRDEVIVSQGLLTGREIERLAIGVAEDTGHDLREIVVETYERGEDPPMA